jgi:hypothetical protein
VDRLQPAISDAGRLRISGGVTQLDARSESRITASFSSCVVSTGRLDLWRKRSHFDRWFSHILLITACQSSGYALPPISHGPPICKLHIYPRHLTRVMSHAEQISSRSSHRAMQERHARHCIGATPQHEHPRPFARAQNQETYPANFEGLSTKVKLSGNGWGRDHIPHHDPQ